MEMGKHIIVFITAILMPFMAYGDICSDACQGDDNCYAECTKCNKEPGHGWFGAGMSQSCELCGYSKYNAGGDGSSGCSQCNNAPQGADYITLEDIQANGWLSGPVVTGLTSNTCPWTMDVTISVSYLGIEHPDIFATLSNVDDVDTTGDEKKLVIKIEDKENKFSTMSDYSNKNQIKTEIQLTNSKTCTINSIGYDNKQGTLTLVSNDCSLSTTQISSLTVTAKKFQYVLVPMNSVEDDNDFSDDSAGNASGVKYGYFGDQIKLENTDEKATYKQYNNCEYDTTNNTVNCKFDTDPTTTGEPTNGLLTLDYEFTYTDGTIIVLERATCTAGKYCPTYTTTGDQDCPDAFSSVENSATSITDCYLDSSVTFFDKNGSKNLITGENTKVYYRGKSNK